MPSGGGTPVRARPKESAARAVDEMLARYERGDVWGARRLAKGIVAHGDESVRDTALSLLRDTGVPKPALVIGAGAALLVACMVLLAWMRG